MTTLTRRIGLALGAAALATGSIAAVYASTQNTADSPRAFMGHRMGGGFGLGRIAAKLNLSDTQKDQIKTVVQSHRDEWKALADRAASARKALNAAVTADTIDETAIRQASSALAGVQGDIAVARARARAEIFQVLTPEQQAQAKQMEARVRARADQFRQRFQNRLESLGR